MVYRLSSFDDVAKAYNDIKPIKGGRASMDLRPLEQRRYWWNRVMKMSDTKYLLLDGNWGWHSNFTDELRELTAPIMWERKEDGDYLTIRSHANEGISVSRYTFLMNHLPKDLFFHYDNGKHFVKHHPSGIDHYLPKFKGVMDWQAGTFEMHQDSKIVFKHDGCNLTRANELQPYKTRRVDKELDAQFKPKVAEFVEWMQLVLPILGETLVSGRGGYASKMTNDRAYSFHYWGNYVSAEEVRQVLLDPEHEKRTALAVCLVNDVNAVDKEGRFAPPPNLLSLLYPRVRKVAGLFATELR
jgi:hypothetical protein